MTAPSPASSAQPGWRGTDPDGGTWVRRQDRFPWWYTAADGMSSAPRSQEEAEAAGLVPLYPVSPVRCTEEGPNGQCDQDARVDHWCTRKGNRLDPEEGDRFTEGVVAAPAPLDPGNPEHLRWWIKDTNTLFDGTGPEYLHDALDSACNAVGAMIRELDRERVEAEQDAADRKLAEDVADEVWSREESAWHIAQKAAQATLARIRAERQEAGQ